MYKLIAFDCDGTLLTSDKKISQHTLASINQIRDMGVTVVLASARPFYRLTKYLSKLGINNENHYSIAFNGGLIVRNDGEETLASVGFTTKETNEIIKMGTKFGTKMFLYYQDGILANMDDEKYRIRNPDVNFNVISLNNYSNFGPIFKIAYVNAPDETKKLRAALPDSFVNKYEVSSSVPQFIEFVSSGITKSNALRMIGEKLNISPAEMIAFGDEENDLPMFDFVGCSVAMGNACEIVKNRATFVTETNDNDGVAVAIEKLIGITL